MASNLPPGVTESMIPGNRPGDAADEELAGRIWEILEPLRKLIAEELSDEQERIHETVEMELFALVSEGYSKGYTDARDDEAMERAALAQDKEPL